LTAGCHGVDSDAGQPTTLRVRGAARSRVVSPGRPVRAV